MPDKIITLKREGLSATEAHKRLKNFGYNELPAERPNNFFAIIFKVLREPMFLLLLVTGGIYLLLGELKDALMLLAAVFVLLIIVLYQENKTEKALSALKDLSSPKARVIRDGQEIVILSREVVVGDLVVLQEGDRVPADGALLSELNLYVDESILTGESLAVRKTEWDGKQKYTGSSGENLPFTFSGTLVTRGRALMKVLATGVNTEIGKIGKSLQIIQEDETLIHHEVRVLIRNFSLVGLGLCFLIMFIYGVWRGEWLNGILAGLALGMAMLPEEFSVVLVVFLALGAWRMSRYNCLARKNSAIETLGAATVLCVDKTGTLTENRMSLQGIVVENTDTHLTLSGAGVLSKEYHQVLEYAWLASSGSSVDPIEVEIMDKGGALLKNEWREHASRYVAYEYSLTSALPVVSYAWGSAEKANDYIVAAKGAPESVARLCRLPDYEIKKIEAQVRVMAEKGWRVLGVAHAVYRGEELPEDQSEFKYEFLGLLGFGDPVRATVKQSVAECYTAGIRVMMITGDYPATAQYIAREIGLKNYDEVITGAELSKLSGVELRKKIKKINVFARVVPDQKLALIRALKNSGEVVVMTGDGVNDAPALKMADVGVAMGKRGTDVARESADVVLVDDNFTSIVYGVKMGRRIFDNLKKAISYIFSIHIPIAGIAMFPVVLDLPVILLPAHIAFLELIIDPACSVVFEAEGTESNIMSRPPRNLKESLLNRSSLERSFLQGLFVLVAIVAVYAIGLRAGLAEDQVRSLTFATIVFGNLILIFTSLNTQGKLFALWRSKNKSLFIIIAVALIALSIVLYVPAARSLFHFGALSGAWLVLSASVMAVVFMVLTGYKSLIKT